MPTKAELLLKQRKTLCSWEPRRGHAGLLSGDLTDGLTWVDMPGCLLKRTRHAALHAGVVNAFMKTESSEQVGVTNAWVKYV